MAKDKKDLNNRNTAGTLGNSARDTTKDVNRTDKSKTNENRDKDDTNVQY
ncbi:MAG: hypothetical protein H7X94_10055 [Vallitaleaceae bacterium]|nr:hypothetical protein [Vallitaleaceae bacterium]